MNNPDIVNMLPYRRSAAVMLLVGIFSVGIWVAGTSTIASSLRLPIILSGLGLIIASITINAIMVILRRFRPISSATFAAYTSLVSGLCLLYGSTGQILHPLIIVWVLTLFLASKWEWRGVIVAAIGGLSVISWQNIGSGFSIETFVTSLTSSLTPIAAAVLQFHSRLSENKEDTLHILAQELSKVSNKSDIVINAIGDGVVAVDNKGIIQLVNPAAEKLTGWTNFDALGLGFETVLKFVNSKDEIATAGSNPVKSVLNGGAPFNSRELRLVTNSGNKLNVSLLVSPIGKFGNGAIIVFRDITREIAQNREQVEFISTASHEMRTPVAAIEGYISLAINPQTATVDERARGYLIKAHESAGHLGRLFQDLLEVSRAEDGRLKNELRVIDTSDFIRESVAMFTEKAIQKHLSIQFLPDVPMNESQTPELAPTTYIHADPDHLREVMSNLLENAIKYTKSGDIEVNARAVDDTVVISVKDSGIGINPEDIPHLFQKFYRIDSSDTREIGGTGLGLYLCRRLVEAMNGRIWVESEAGKGSTFFVSLARLESSRVAELTQNTAPNL